VSDLNLIWYQRALILLTEFSIHGTLFSAAHTRHPFPPSVSCRSELEKLTCVNFSLRLAQVVSSTRGAEVFDFLSTYTAKPPAK
jgi:hypothetical protein